MPSADMKEHQIRYDYTNMLAEAVGEHGVTAAELADVEKRTDEVFDTLARQRGEGILGFQDLPYDETTAGAVMKLAASYKGRFENLVVLGIGGSGLGAITLRSALCHPLHNMLDAEARGGSPRLFVLDNIDPDAIAAVMDFVRPEETLFNVVTKSGRTAETMSQLLVFYERVKQELGPRVNDRFVATTDPEDGELRKIARDFGWESLPIPPNVGGRFSVLSAVGLFPAAMVGIDVRQLLSGAAFMDRRCEGHATSDNPALAFAMLQYALFLKGANISVMMPYSSALADVADWYRQLWAESLGKKVNFDGALVNTGPTPVKALGATDQHSQVQLYTEGPYDKSVTFIEVGKFDRQVNIPKTFSNYEEARYLNGHSLNELLAAELRGTQVALTAAGRPNATIVMPEISAFSIGQLFYMLEFATAMSGALYRVNTFDQPGVEAGRRAAYALMGRPGFETIREEIENALSGHRRIV